MRELLVKCDVCGIYYFTPLKVSTPSISINRLLIGVASTPDEKDEEEHSEISYLEDADWCLIYDIE